MKEKMKITSNRTGKQKEKYQDIIMLIHNGFFDNIINQCNYCGCGFHSAIKNGNITTNLTAQRVLNSEPHTLDNIIAYCKRCNCSCK